MSTYTNSYTQSTNEITTYTVDYADLLPSGGTVSSATATHIPSGGTASTPTVQVTSPYVYVTFPAQSVMGTHYLDILATFSDNDKANVRLAINIVYPTPTARSGMSSIITQLRLMTNAGINDFSIVDIPYWTDAQINTILDKNSIQLIHSEIEAEYPQYLSGNVLSYTQYPIGYEYVEQSSGGTAIFIVQNNAGGTVSASDYSVDYTKGIVTFNADTKGIEYYVTGFAYDIYAAAAEIMQMKANAVSNQFDFSTDNHSIKKSQVYTNYIKQMDYFRSKSKNSGGHGMMYREDTC